MKVFFLLKNLTYSQLNSFHQYIECRLFNGNQQLISLFKAMINTRLYKVKAKNISKEALWRSMHNKPFNKTKFIRAVSDLSKLIEDFLAFEKYQNNVLEKENNVLLVYFELDQEKFFRQAERLAKGTFMNFMYRDGAYYNQLYFHQTLCNSFQTKHFQRKSNINYFYVDESLDVFYIIQKLKLYCEMLNAQRIINVTYKISQINEIFKIIEANNYLKIPSIHIYFLISKTFLFNDRRYFDILKELLKENIAFFNEVENRSLYSYLFNYCIRNINQGNSEFLREIFSLYDFTLEKNILVENGKLSPWDYKNIVATGLRLKEYEWSEKFIVDYKRLLPISHRNNAYLYNLARLLFEKKEFKELLRTLQDVEFDDIFYSLDARSLLIKTYYELEDWFAMEYAFNSFSQYIRRNKNIARSHKANYLHFIKLTKMLYKLRLDKSITSPQIQQELNETTQIADKSWIQEKIDNILVKM
jgi:hypothetical protein